MASICEENEGIQRYLTKAEEEIRNLEHGIAVESCFFVVEGIWRIFECQIRCICE